MDYLECDISQGTDSHTNVIRCIAFNATGSLIASGGDDCSVKIWEAKGSTLKFHIEGHASVLSLAWTVDPYILIAGFEDGVVVTIIITKTSLETYSVCLRETQRRPVCPIETLSLNNRTAGSKTLKIKLATGGHRRVRVWSQRECSSYQWSTDYELPDPFLNGINHAKEVLVTGLEWLNESSLLVSYMYHGLIIWDSVAKTTTNSIPVPSAIGRMAVSPDGSNIAVSNFRDGVDIWDRFKHGLKKSYKVPRSGRRFPLPVIFLHGGYTVALGSTDGRVSYWDVRSGELVDELEHPGKSVHALASYFSHDAVKKEDKFVIATTTSAGNRHRIHIWEASRSAIMSKRKNKAWLVGCQRKCTNCLVYTLVGGVIVTLGAIVGTLSSRGTAIST